MVRLHPPSKGKIWRMSDFYESIIKGLSEAKTYVTFKKRNIAEVNKVVIEVLEELKDLEPYINNASENNASAFLKFKDERLRSVAIRDISVRPRYRYKWNIVLGYSGERMITDGRVTRFFYSEKELPIFYKSIRSYYNTILGSKK